MSSEQLNLRDAYGLQATTVLRNPSVARLYEDALLRDGAAITSTGALVSLSGDKTGRSPQDKRVVDEPSSSEHIWWGKVNIKLAAESFDAVRQRAVDFLGQRERLYVIDGFAGWDPAHQLVTPSTLGSALCSPAL